jgi:GNAT superfamily N-acetyltransferase
VAELYAECSPEEAPPTAQGFRHWVESEPERARFGLWVAEDGGRLMGFAMAAFHWSMSTRDVGWIWAGVREGERRRGLGSALFARGEEHLRAHAARKLESFTLEGGAGDTFLQGRGYRRTRVELKQVLDLSRVEPGDAARYVERKAREGFTLVPLEDLRDRPRDVHAVYAAATADIPADDPEDDVPFEDWEAQDLRDPELSSEGSFVVLHERRPVALAFLLVNAEARVAANEMTGTLPEYRGRGLARLAKLATIRWAAERGLGAVYTGNDSENAPMLALNRSLGYQVRWRRLFFAQERGVA